MPRRPDPGYDFGVLLGLAFQTFVDHLNASLARHGFADIRPAFGYVFRAPPQLSPPCFRPSRRATAMLVPLVVAALGFALFLRYGIIQNTPIGLACEAGEESLTCMVRLAVILLFVRSVFGWTALVAAVVQLIRPNRIAFGIGLIAAALGVRAYMTA